MTFSKKYLPKFFFFLIVLISNISCEKVKSEPEPELRQEQPIQYLEKEAEKTKPAICYSLYSIENISDIDSFRTRYSEEQQRIILNLNRIDQERLHVGLKIIIPDPVSHSFHDYSPFPDHLNILDSLSKAVLISQRIQGFATYENGKLISWGPLSSGKKSTPTPNGLFYGNYKAKRKISTVNEAWIMPYYFNYMNYEGVGVHQYTLPGYPASHACVRLVMEDAKFIYYWADGWQLDEKGHKVIRNGTPFMIYGDYDFNKPVPWLDLVHDHTANNLTEDELEILRAYVEAYDKDERNVPEKRKQSIEFLNSL